jgi:hypothetical protein
LSNCTLSASSSSRQPSPAFSIDHMFSLLCPYVCPYSKPRCFHEWTLHMDRHEFADDQPIWLVSGSVDGGWQCDFILVSLLWTQDVLCHSRGH